MTISKELEAKVLRYHFVEKWRINTIARQLNLHHTTVSRVLAQAGVQPVARKARASILDPWRPFILETLEQYPTLTAARLYEMAQARGYRGGESHFRHRIAELRPRKPAEAYLRLNTLPGEEMQVDWGHFGSIHIGRAERPLMAFVAVLSYSRQTFLRFYLNQQTPNFLRGHDTAFRLWGGVAKVILYDNLKSAVLERRDNAIRFNPALLEFAAHYRYEPRPVAPYRGNQKGRVERKIRHIRSAFFTGLRYRDLDDLNARAETWCRDQANRSWPQDRSITIGQAFEQEKPLLLPLPDDAFPTDERVEVQAGKTPYVRFDLNDYSIPHTEVRQSLSVLASLEQVRILKGHEEIARHRRSFGKGEQIEEVSHIEKLIAWKREAGQHRGQDRLARCVPASQELLRQGAQHYSLRQIVSRLEQLLEDYGAAELDAAIEENLKQNAFHPNSIHLTLERRREQRETPPPIAVPLSAQQRARDVVVRPASLDVYDSLGKHTDQPEENAS